MDMDTTKLYGTSIISLLLLAHTKRWEVFSVHDTRRPAADGEWQDCLGGEGDSLLDVFNRKYNQRE